MGLKIKSLDFTLITPTQDELHYSGPYIRTLPQVITIAPNKVYSIEIEDITNNVFAYEFIPGKYTVQGHYFSGHAWGSVWKGQLESLTYTFVIE